MKIGMIEGAVGACGGERKTERKGRGSKVERVSTERWKKALRRADDEGKEAASKG